MYKFPVSSKINKLWSYNVRHDVYSLDYCTVHLTITKKVALGLPWWLSGKESAYNAGDRDSVPGLGRSPGEGNGNPLQYPCLGNPMDRGDWRATVHGVAKSRT